MKNNNVNCPLCSKTHKIVIEFESEMQHHKTLCIEHKKDMNLFCTESGCEIPICVLCLKDEHKNHEFGDLDEMMSERCCDMDQNDTIGKIELNPLSSCQVIILIARMTFNCSTSCLMS